MEELVCVASDDAKKAVHVVVSLFFLSLLASLRRKTEGLCFTRCKAGSEGLVLATSLRLRVCKPSCQRDMVMF